MIKSLIQSSVNNRIIVFVIFLCILIASIFSIKTANIDAIPDIGENQQIVFTKWQGRSPKDIEEQITYPLSIFLQGIPGVKNIRASSAFGFSSIYIIFKDDVDFYWSRTRVLEKLSNLGKILPPEVNPQLGPDATGLGQIFWYTIENKKNTTKPLSLDKLRSLQDYYIRYRLQSIKGVSEVAGVGGFIKEYQIDVDPKKLFAYDIHFSKLVKSVKNSNIDVGAELLESGSREFIIRGKGFFTSLEDIENVVIAIKNKTPIRVKDVANVGFGPGFRRGVLDKNGKEVVGGVVTMRFGENPQKIITNIKKELKNIKKGLPKSVKLTAFYDRSQLINKTISTIYSTLSAEIIITIFVIFLFLLHLKSSILVSLILPFGIGISFILMKLLNIDSNIMSLAGLVIAIGSMVDMGIIMTENIYSSLSKVEKISNIQRIQIIINSAKEIGPAIVIAAATSIVTFLPIFALQGSEGKLFGPLAWTKTLAMFGSVLVAIVLVPALAVYFLKGQLKSIKKNIISLLIIKIYKKLLLWVLNNRKKFLSFPLILLILSGFAFSKLGKEFMPALNEGDILYMPVTTPNISISKARKLLAYTDKELSKHPLVDYSIGKLGRADSALDPAPISMFETLIKLLPKNKWPKGTSIYDIMEDLDKSLQIPGLVNSWNFPIQTRIAMISTGIKTQIGIKIFGPNLKVLESLGKQIGKEIKKIKGAYGIYSEKITGKSYLEFTINRVSASRYGINTGTINKILQTAVGGMSIGQFYEGRKRYPIRIRYKKELRHNIEELKKVLVPSPLGQHIPLMQLADIKITTGPAMIQSENGLLRSLVLLNVRGRDLIGFVNEAKKHIAKSVKLPELYSISWEGQYRNQVRASNRLYWLIPLSLLINLLIIFIGIKSFRNSLIIFSAIPIAISGGLILLYLTGFNTSVAVWVGFIALCGIAVDDGVVMMTYLQKNIKEQIPKNWGQLKDCILFSGTRRIRPLIMTTLTTVIALLPVMWATSTGSEVIKPMAIPILGGMLVEVITLFMVPVIFSYFEEKKLKSQNNFL